MSAKTTMYALNPNALVSSAGLLGTTFVAVEDWCDPDGRLYRLEYQASHDGRRAIAFCRFNPWGGQGNPSAGADYHTAHVGADGFICLGGSSERVLSRSPYALTFAVQRARYWCTAFSVFMESGYFPQP